MGHVAYPGHLPTFVTCFKQFPDQVSHFQLNIFFFLSQSLYFSMEKSSIEIVLVLNIYPFQDKKNTIF